MSRDSLLSRKLPFSSAAVLAAAATSDSGEFRPRDVRFFLELFSNWVEISFEQGVLQVQNTQIGRFLEGLSDGGLLQRRNRKGKAALYYATRSGIVELTSMLLHDTGQGRRERFFFIVYFISSYKEVILSMVAQDKKRYPYILSVELDRLLDSSSLLDSEIKRTEQEIKQLELRIGMAFESADLFEREIATGREMTEAIKLFQNRFPYAMNNVKPLGELVTILPKNLQCWELGAGSRKRALDIWQPHLDMLVHYLGQLQELEKRV